MGKGDWFKLSPESQGVLESFPAPAPPGLVCLVEVSLAMGLATVLSGLINGARTSFGLHLYGYVLG